MKNLIDIMDLSTEEIDELIEKAKDIIKNPELIAELERKLRIIIGFEHKNPNKFEQRITDIYDFLVNKRMDS